MPIATPARELSRDEVAQGLRDKYFGQKNVLGTQLKACTDHDALKVSGWHRDGYCGSSATDRGLHVVCTSITEGFLQFSVARGNNLREPRPPYFWGLNPGDHWCICASRWLEAYKCGQAPDVFLESTHDSALSVVPLEYLIEHALDLPPGEERTIPAGASADPSMPSDPSAT